MRPQFRAKSQGRYGKRHKPGEMNKTETKYAAHLNTLIAAGSVHQWWFEAFKFRVAYNSCWLTVDFMVQLADGTIELHDVKGGPTEEDAAIKEKLIAQLFPFRLLEVRLKRGVWEVTEISLESKAK